MDMKEDIKKQFISSILDVVFNNTVEKKLPLPIENTVNILCNKVIEKQRPEQRKCENLNEATTKETIRLKDGEQEIEVEKAWIEHLHWPKQEDEGKSKRKGRDRTLMPYAITSRNWLKFHQEQEKNKTENQLRIETRKLERKQKKIDREMTQVEKCD
ncbi:hypothetical protein FQR65_LT06058 [Abscondita terminalis]|nr:hypothetical protein FQR65_LT06058 [Abscondita terminalis]